MNSVLLSQRKSITDAARHPWRPLFWEPVSGTGERLLVGVVYGYDGEFATARMLRDETLDCLYGKRSLGARNIIEHGLAIFLSAARAVRSLDGLSAPVMGIFPGELRNTAARSASELLRVAALMHSSLANLDKLDEFEEGDAPLPEEVNRRFSTEVKDIALRRRPDLATYFGASAELVEGGQRVRFGFCSPHAVAHFNVFYPLRLSASMRDARARLFELQQARVFAENLAVGALIGAVSRDDDATLSDKQRAQLREARDEINSEAAAAGLAFYPVITAEAGADQIVALAA